MNKGQPIYRLFFLIINFRTSTFGDNLTYFTAYINKLNQGYEFSGLASNLRSSSLDVKNISLPSPRLCVYITSSCPIVLYLYNFNWIHFLVYVGAYRTCWLWGHLLCEPRRRLDVLR